MTQIPTPDFLFGFVVGMVVGAGFMFYVLQPILKRKGD